MLQALPGVLRLRLQIAAARSRNSLIQHPRLLFLYLFLYHLHALLRSSLHLSDLLPQLRHSLHRRSSMLNSIHSLPESHLRHPPTPRSPDRASLVVLLVLAVYILSPLRPPPPNLSHPCSATHHRLRSGCPHSRLGREPVCCIEELITVILSLLGVWGGWALESLPQRNLILPLLMEVSELVVWIVFSPFIPLVFHSVVYFRRGFLLYSLSFPITSWNRALSFTHHYCCLVTILNFILDGHMPKAACICRRIQL